MISVSNGMLHIELEPYKTLGLGVDNSVRLCMEDDLCVVVKCKNMEVANKLFNLLKVNIPEFEVVQHRKVEPELPALVPSKG